MPRTLIASSTINKTTDLNQNVKFLEPIVYPLNLLSDYSDHIYLTSYQYISLTEYFNYNAVKLQVNTTSTTTPGSGSFNLSKIFGVDNGGKGIAENRFIKGEILSKIMLPMPNDIVISDSPSWALEDLRTMGRFLPTFGNEFAKGDTTNASETLSALAKAGIPEMLLGLAEQSNLFSSREAITQGFNSKILNPYYEQIFKGIEPRTFTVKYKLVPRNSKESLVIKQLLNTLRTNSLPNYSRQSKTDDFTQNGFDGLGDRWLTTPNIFNLEFRTIDDNNVVTPITSLPKFKPMVLTSIAHNYTPDGKWNTHLNDNGEVTPIAIMLELTFAETEIITAKEVEIGY